MAWDASRAAVASRAGRGRRLAVPAIFALVLALVLPLMLAAPAQAGLGDYRCSDTGRVYHGNARLIRKPAVCSADRVYRHIPEYQTIVNENLTEKDVRYHFLMKAASKKFLKAVKGMARENGYDFVAEVGAVQVVNKDAPAPADETAAVIGKLS